MQFFETVQVINLVYLISHLTSPVACATSKPSKIPNEVPDIAQTFVQIHNTDSPQVKELKRLFNARDTDGFIKYWQKSGLTPNFEDTYGRGFIHWVVGANVHADPKPLITISPINMYFTSQHESATNWDKKDVTGQTGLHYAVVHNLEEMAQLYHARGANPGTQNNEGKNSLHLAAERDYRGLITQLLSGSEDQPRLRADVLYAVDKNGLTPLHYAAMNNFMFIAEVLAKNAPNPENYVTYRPAGFPSVPSPFQAAVANNSYDVVEVFVDLIKADVELIKADPDGYLPLELAASYGSEKMVKLLINRFRKGQLARLACFPDAEGRNALHYAARYGHVEVMRLILRYMSESDKETCLNKGAVNGWTPLHYAARYHHNEAVDFILKATAGSVKMKQTNGLTPLALAAHGCTSREDNAVVMKLLIRAGAAEEEADGQKSLQYANEVCKKRGCSSCVAATQDPESIDLDQRKYPLKCDIPEERSPFSSPLISTRTLAGTRDCGVPRIEKGRPLCFYVEVIDYTGFQSPSQGNVIGMGVVIDEFLVSVPASIFIMVESLFQRRVLSLNRAFAIRTPGHGSPNSSQQKWNGRFVQVSGRPNVHKAFSVHSPGHDLAFLRLAEPISEFKDGVCFLCLPIDEVPPACLENCFVVTPHGPSGGSTSEDGSNTAQWTKYTPKVISNEFCERELASLGFKPDAKQICLENVDTGNSAGCGDKSSVLVCQRQGAVRLYGHLLFSPGGDSSNVCNSGNVHGVFSSLQTTQARSFYQTALELPTSGTSTQ